MDDAGFREPPPKIAGEAERFDHRADNDDHTQAGTLYRLMGEAKKQRLAANLVGALKPVPRAIQECQAGYLREADPDNSRWVAAGH